MDGQQYQAELEVQRLADFDGTIRTSAPFANDTFQPKPPFTTIAFVLRTRLRDSATLL